MEFITYEVEGQIGIITINRPKALNALNSAVLMSWIRPSTRSIRKPSVASSSPERVKRALWPAPISAG